MTQHKFVEYRNGFYQGGFVKGRREGKGIMITDSGQIFIGNWKNDTLNERALIWIDEKTHVIGDFNRGQMDGEFIYRNSKRLFYAVFSNDRLNGKKLLTIDRVEQKASVIEYKNQQYNAQKEQSIQYMSDSQIFQDKLGYNVEFPTIHTYIEQQLLKDETFEMVHLKTGCYYIGYKKGIQVQRLGFVLLKDQLVSFGVYKDTVLQGLGYQFANKKKYQGVFKNGLLNGLGLKYQMLKNQCLIGKFEDGNLKQNEYLDGDLKNIPDLSDMKRALHLKSMYFFNSFIQSNSLLKYSGYEQTISRSHPQQQYVYPEASPKKKSSLNNSSIIQSKSSHKLPTSEYQIPSISKSRRKNDDDPQLKGASILLSKLESKNYTGSLSSNIKQYEDLNSSNKKKKYY